MATSGPFSASFIRRFYLDVAHVNLFVHEEHGSPSPFLAPVFGTGGFIDRHDFHLSAMIFDPLLAALVDDGHEITLAAVLVGLFGTMVVCPFV